MKIVYEGEEYYVSYWHNRDYKQSERDSAKSQFRGVTPYWVKSFEEDCLIEGYRHAQATNPKMNAREILEKLRIESFDGSMPPKQTIRLTDSHLNIEAMRDDFLAYKSTPDHKWAFFSGYQFHAKGAHNCASIIRYLLKRGGLDRHILSYSEIFRVAALALVAYQNEWSSEIVGKMLWAVAGASLLGGAIDGCLDVQQFVRVIKIQGRKQFTPLVVLAASIVSGLSSLLFQDHIIAKCFTLPNNVMNDVYYASNRLI